MKLTKGYSELKEASFSLPRCAAVSDKHLCCRILLASL